MDASASYRFGDVGWLLFEEVATALLERERAIAAGDWEGHADRRRRALGPDGREWRMVWVRRGDTLEERVHARAGARVGIVTNVDVPASDAREYPVLGQRELSAALERHPEVGLRWPSVFGVRAPAAPAVSGATLDLAAARELAAVFVPVRAYVRALDVVRAHRFVVLTGPPEMGKTAIARMLGLALSTTGWQVHECNHPRELWERMDAGRAQLFIADDAFGSTEYRPEAAEWWARDMDRILRGLDERHWLAWTSRPAPLKAALERIQRERGAERFPAPGRVIVDAGALDAAEKALILLRQAKAAGASGRSAAALRNLGTSIVEHPHFTPERIRRFARRHASGLEALDNDVSRLRSSVRREIAEPTEAMAASYRALDGEHRALLAAMLDTPPGTVHERDLIAAARRHADAGLAHEPIVLIDRLTDHFLRVVA